MLFKFYRVAIIMILPCITCFLTVGNSTCLIRAHKKLSTIISWENTKKATVEAQLKTIEVFFS